MVQAFDMMVFRITWNFLQGLGGFVATLMLGEQYALFLSLVSARIAMSHKHHMHDQP